MKIIEIDKSSEFYDRAVEDELKNYKYEFLSFDGSISYILYDEDKDVIVGQINYKISFDQGDILYLYINKEYRGSGYSKILLKDTLSMLKSKGIKEVFLEVKSTNLIAYNLYKNIGFVNISIRKSYYDDADAIIMKANIG